MGCGHAQEADQQWIPSATRVRRTDNFGHISHISISKVSAISIVSRWISNRAYSNNSPLSCNNVLCSHLADMAAIGDLEYYEYSPLKASNVVLNPLNTEWVSNSSISHFRTGNLGSDSDSDPDDLVHDIKPNKPLYSGNIQAGVLEEIDETELE